MDSIAKNFSVFLKVSWTLKTTSRFLTKLQ